MSEAIAVIGLDAFLQAEAASEFRHELVGGRVYGLAGGSERHELASGLLFEAMAPGVRSAGCRPFIANRMLRTPSGNVYYPDIMVACGTAAHRLYETDATLIVAVLSPSTTDVDRREKAVAYAEAPSLQQLILVDPDVRRIEVARPEGGAIRTWEAFGPGSVVRTPYGDIDVDALYEAIDTAATAT